MGYARELEQACRLGSDPNSLPDRPDGFKDPASGCSMIDFGPTPVGSASLATSGYPVIRTVSCQAATGQARSYPNVGYPLGTSESRQAAPHPQQTDGGMPWHPVPIALSVPVER